ncbi:hypothetical protein [Chamaesiphon minutus]|uniref:hypothetical protein n=1 Tax=Chamaesiphon minutus TaxID=1173032 RepID=UPI0005A08F07|nr:hypothetical protein [Chamaesiphon minutus]
MISIEFYLQYHQSIHPPIDRLASVFLKQHHWQLNCDDRTNPLTRLDPQLTIMSFDNPFDDYLATRLRQR